MGPSLVVVEMRTVRQMLEAQVSWYEQKLVHVLKRHETEIVQLNGQIVSAKTELTRCPKPVQDMTVDQLQAIFALDQQSKAKST